MLKNKWKKVGAGIAAVAFSFLLAAGWENGNSKLCCVAYADSEIKPERYLGDSEDGSNIYYVPDSTNGILYIKGSGRMRDFTFKKKENGDIDQPMYMDAIRLFKKVVIDDEITYIGDRAFYGMTNLETVEFGSGIEEIGDYAFLGCIQLSSVSEEITNVSKIGNSAFQSTAISELEIWENLEEVGDNCFSGTKISTITIPASLKSVGSYLFAECRSLESVIIQNDCISEAEFHNCESLSSVTLENSQIDAFPDYAFGHCGKLVFHSPNDNNNPDYQVTIPAQIETLGFMVFSGCDIESIQIPDSVESIGNSICSDMNSLKKAKISSSSVTCLPERTFSECQFLTEIDMPYITQIGEYAFAYCRSVNINSILESKITSIGDYAFFSVPVNDSKGYVQVGSQLEAIGKQALGYESFGYVYNNFYVSCHARSCLGEYVKNNLGIKLFTGKYLCSDSDEDDRCDECHAWMKSKVVGIELALSGSVEINWYLAFTEQHLSDTKAKIDFLEYNHKTVTDEFSLSDGIYDEETDCYIFKTKITPKEITTYFDVKYIPSSGTEWAMVQRKPYSVAEDYAQQILAPNSAYSSEVKDLVYALLQYGGATQDYFGTLAADIDDDRFIQGYEVNNSEAEPDNVTADSIREKVVTVGDMKNINFSGSSLALQGNTQMLLFFKLKDGVSIDDLTFTYGNQPLEVKNSNTFYYIVIPDILAQNLDRDVSVSIENSVTGQDDTFVFNPMNYCYSALTNTNGKTDVQLNLIRSIVAYNKAAKALIQ